MYQDFADFSVKELEKLGCSYAEARLEDIKGSAFIMKNGNIEISGFDKSIGLGLRYTINNTLGFVAINDLNKSRILNLIKRSVNLTRNSSKIRQKINFSEEKTVKANYKVKQKIKLDSLSAEEKIKFLLDLDKDVNKKYFRYFSLNGGITKKYYTNTEGTKINSEIPGVSLYYFITVLMKNKSMQRYCPYGSTGGWEVVKKWDLKQKLINEIKALENVIKNGVKPPKGKIDIVVGPEVTGIASHESVGHPYEADRILGREAAQAGESFIKQNMIDYQIGSEVVNLVDDPTLPGSNGFYLYDDEGVKARRKTLIKNGKINEFLHNRETAFEMGIKSNGASRAAEYNKEAIVRMSNTFVLPGDYKEEELFEDIKLGIYMKNFMEWNIDDKRFQQKYTGAEAYLIKNGKITKPVINPVLEITTPALWKSVDAISKKLEFTAGSCGKGEPMQGIPVWFGGPQMRLKNIIMR
jgi:TldD protein